MVILFHFIILIVALAFTSIASNFVVKAALTVAKRLGWSQDLTGLTIISLGVKLPEIIIIFSGALKQFQGEEVTQLVMGNIVGSNMSQISLVMGLTGLFQTIKVKKSEVMSNGLMLIASSFLFFIFALNGTISQLEGVILLLIYAVFVVTLKKTTCSNLPKTVAQKFSFKKNLRSIAKLMVGMIVIAISSNSIVNESALLADLLNLNQLIVGLFVIGIGVSLPELIIAISALKQGLSDLSVGSMLRGNIVVILVGLGITSLLEGWSIPRNIATFDLAYLLLTTVVVVLFLLTKKKLEKKESVLILALYGIFVVLKSLGF